MSKENRKLVADALRSGEYKQCKGALCRVNVGYCCLGVATEVYMAQGHTDVNKKQSFDLETIEYCDGNDSHTGHLPEPVAKWLGMKPTGQFVDGYKFKGKAYGTLINVNDDSAVKNTFEEIADLFETAEFA